MVMLRRTLAWKYAVAVIVILGFSVYVSHEDQTTRDQYEQKCAQLNARAASPTAHSEDCDKGAENAARHLPRWHGVFGWPEGITTWAILLTLLAIADQTSQTRRAAGATEDAVKASEISYKLARDTSERELRAYLTVTNARLFLYEDGSIEPRLTISNSGQTPAYEFKGIQALSLDGRPLASSISRPSDDILLRYGTVGRDYWLTGEMRKVGTTKQQVMDYLMSGEMHLILYGWYKYQDVFGHIHPLDFQLVVSQRGTLSRGQDSENEWLVFFDDWEAIPAERQQKDQNPN
jgi:hypothetical protein